MMTENEKPGEGVTSQATLERARNLIDLLFDRLEHEVKNNTARPPRTTKFPRRFEKKSAVPEITDTSAMETAPWLWGEKESVVSVLTKLTPLLIKLVELEEQMKDRGASLNSDDQQLDESDWQMIEDYVREKLQGEEKVALPE